MFQDFLSAGSLPAWRGCEFGPGNTGPNSECEPVNTPLQHAARIFCLLLCVPCSVCMCVSFFVLRKRFRSGFCSVKQLSLTFYSP